KGPVAMSSGLKLVADESFDSFSIAPQSLDTLLIAGGNGVYQAGFQKDFLDFIKTQGGQSQFSTSLAQQFAVKGILKETLTWMNQNPDKAMSIDSLAHRCAMSERNFARIFKQEVGMTPGKYVEKMRVEYAVRQIETHDQGFKLIAHISGFDSEERMRRAFKRQLNVLPHLYRKRFGR
ncbi:MAG: helix-turn-helix domain-containing protein, partial [Proteobacteria bacterium]|nr:helix-turn-helix domain-containing protein [Pseudomonadota bacterium]